MIDKNDSKIDQLLDLLLDALQERQAARQEEKPDDVQPIPVETEISDPIIEPETAEIPHLEPQPSEPEFETFSKRSGEPYHIPSEFMPEKLPSIQLDRMLGRLAIFLFALVVIVNIPLNRFGTNLARAMPDEQALVIRDGLVLKGSGEEIFVLENNQKRWISSLDAFEYYGYRWSQVNVVDDGFLDRVPTGPALSVLRKCQGSPHVFAIENGVKRWIKDIPTFESQGYLWEDVQTISCTALRQIPTGSPIPPDAGESPIP
jgi:hypothetical protein